MNCEVPTIPLPIPLPAAAPGLTPLPGPTLRVKPLAERLLDPIVEVVSGGRRVAVIPAGRARAVVVVETELALPVLPELAVRLAGGGPEDAVRGTVRVEDGFRVVVGTKPDDGFLCDCRRPAEVDTESGFEACRLVGIMGEDGVFRL